MKAIKWIFSELRRRKVAQTFLPYLGVMWLLLQVVAVLTPMLNFHPLVATFVAIVLFALCPVALYLSWYYDITAQGLVAVEVDQLNDASQHGVVWWSTLIVIMTASAWVGFRYFSDVSVQFYKQRDGIEMQVSANSIAVLPFRDQSADKDQRYLADGLTEELTSVLGQVEGLTVSAATAVFALTEQQLMPIDIAKRLNAQTLLTGSIHSVGNRLKLRAELVAPESGKVLWSKSFSRELTDVFDIEEEISRTIVNLLQDRYLEMGSLSATAKSASSDAYIMYLKGREQYRLQTTESIKAARRYFEQALALDPEYAMAYVALADSIILLAEGDGGFGIIKADIAATLAQQNIEKALVRAPNLAEAHAVRGLLLSHLLHETDDALSAFDKALSINPNLASAQLWRFATLTQLGRQDDAWLAIEQAYKLDPVSITTQYNRALMLANNGEFLLADRQYQQLISEYPASPMGFAGLADSATQQGQLAQSVKFWHQAYQLSPDNMNYKQSFIGSLLELGLVDEAKALTDDPLYNATILLRSQQYDALFTDMDFQLQAHPEEGWIQFEAAWYHLLVGNTEQGKQLLLAAYNSLTKDDLYALPLCSPAIEIAWLQQQLMQPDAAKLLQSCLPYLQPRTGGYQNIYQRYLAARIAALQGNNAKAIELLRSAISNGWSQWWTEFDPLLTTIKQQPEVQKLFLTIQQNLLTQQRQAQDYLQQVNPQ